MRDLKQLMQIIHQDIQERGIDMPPIISEEKATRKIIISTPKFPNKRTDFLDVGAQKEIAEWLKKNRPELFE